MCSEPSSHACRHEHGRAIDRTLPRRHHNLRTVNPPRYDTLSPPRHGIPSTHTARHRQFVHSDSRSTQHDTVNLHKPRTRPVVGAKLDECYSWTGMGHATYIPCNMHTLYVHPTCNLHAPRTTVHCAAHMQDSCNTHATCTVHSTIHIGHGRGPRSVRS